MKPTGLLDLPAAVSACGGSDGAGSSQTPTSSAAKATTSAIHARGAGTAPYYVAAKLTEAAGRAAAAKSYESGHELNEDARTDLLAWLRQRFDLD